ncbi:hypothetical protein A9168_08195 [Macellibacteroides sp. HH-ZS]|nr:hypothetical protein A9168_08195 [Macellibacteroides sp. HH-ZS]
MKKHEKTEHAFWIITGLELLVWPPEPAVGDWEALHKWEPYSKGVWACIKFRFKLGFWGYNLTSNNVINNKV